MTTSTRDRILDSYVDLLVEHGGLGVSLEAVAARAGVSKGGLLYHFPTKASLLVGLTARLRAYTEVNIARARAEGIVRTFLQTSTPRHDEARHYWAALTAVAADRRGSPAEATQALHDAFDDWSALLGQEVNDPVLADTIRIVGDGLFLSTVAGLPRPDDAGVLAVIAHLQDLASRAVHNPEAQASD